MGEGWRNDACMRIDFLALGAPWALKRDTRVKRRYRERESLHLHGRSANAQMAGTASGDLATSWSSQAQLLIGQA